MAKLPPDETSVTYGHLEEKCPNCQKNTNHLLGIAWGEGVYKETKTCVPCGYTRSWPTTRERCIAINALAFDS